MHSLIAVMSVLAIASACKSQKGAGAGRQVEGVALETRPANAPKQTPAFPGQTRAPFQTANVAFTVQTVASNLEHPWGLAFLPDGGMIVTERPGRMRILRSDGAASPPVAGIPEVDARDQGGLLDVAIDPQYATTGLVYWSFAEKRATGNGTSVARGKLVAGTEPRMENVQVIWRNQPDLDSTMHFGGRLVFARDGMLFVTTGERSILEGRKHAQDLASTFGKVVRIQPDGKVPQDNPLVGKGGTLPEIYSWGHRNVQAAALHPDTGKLWVVDHGAKGGDEINVVEAGKDYGWPTITYGIEYAGGPIGEGLTQKAGMEQPIYYWDPVIAPSGMAFYTGTMFPAWRGNLFVGALAGKHLARVVLDGTRVVGEERLLADRGRIRDVRVGPDGAIYVLTDEDAGELLKLVAAEGKSGS